MFFWSDIDGEPGLAFVMLLVDEAWRAVVQTQEYDLWDVFVRVVFCDELFFGGGEGVVADDGLDVAEFGVGELGGGFYEGFELVEEEEGGAEVGEGGGEELVVVAEEGDAV